MIVALLSTTNTSRYLNIIQKDFYHSLLILTLMSILSMGYSCPLHGALGNTLVDSPDSADHLGVLAGGQVVNLWQHPVSSRHTKENCRMVGLLWDIDVIDILGSFNH